MKEYEKILTCINSLAVLAILAFHSYIGWFSRFMADDFCSAYQAGRLGILRSTWYWYLNWSGRFSASALDAGVTLLGQNFTPFVTSLTLLIWIISLYLLISRALFPQNKLETFFLSLVILYQVITISPDIRQSLYWGQGMRAVIPPFILNALFLSILFLQDKTISQNLNIYILPATGFLLNFISGGFNETFSATQIILLGFIAVLMYWQSGQLKKSILFAGILGGILAAVVVILAPGNAIRQSYYPSHPSILQTLQISLNGFGILISQFIYSPEKLLALMSLVGFSFLAGAHNKSHSMSGMGIIFILLFGIGLAFSCFIPAAYAMFDIAPERTQIISVYYIVITLATSSMLAGQHYQTVFSKNHILLSASILTFLLVGSTVLSGQKLYSSRNEFIQYANWWDATDQSIRTSKNNGETEITIPVVENWARLNTPGDNLRFWVNSCIRGYYGIKILGQPVQ